MQWSRNVSSIDIGVRCLDRGYLNGHNISADIRLGKNKLLELRGVQLLKRFSAKFVLFSAKFGPLNVQIRKNFKNVIFIAYK